MIDHVIVPDLGATGTDVILSEWLVSEGAYVTAGTPLFAVETDKAVDQVEAFRAGFLRRHLAPAGARVAIGSAVAILADTLDEPLELGAEASSRDAQSAAPVRTDCRPLEQPALATGRVRASPLARRIARELGVDLNTVIGRGPGGAVRKDDVLAATPGSPDGAKVAGRSVALSPMRAAIAQRTASSKAEVPHFYAGIEIDLTDVLTTRRQLRDAGRPTPSVNDLIVHAAARALRATPRLNATFHQTEIVYHDDVDIGVVVASEDRMLIPVVRRADRLDLSALSTQLSQLRERVVAGTLTAREQAGGSLTVSNLGMLGIDDFTAIINPPQAAILACGAARPQPVARAGEIVIRTVMKVNLSVDHRVADGVVAARFLLALRGWLEDPTRCFAPDAGESV